MDKAEHSRRIAEGMRLSWARRKALRAAREGLVANTEVGEPTDMINISGDAVMSIIDMAIKKSWAAGYKAGRDDGWRIAMTRYRASESGTQSRNDPTKGVESQAEDGG
jgi:hypothetical protein